MIYTETPRLLLRDWKEEDIEPFAAINRDPFVMEYFLKPLTENESLNFYHRIKNEFAEYGYGLYALERKDNGAFIGYTGFHRIPFNPNCDSEVEIGWRIRHKDWNQGLATEAAKACLRYAKENSLFTSVCSFTSATNKSSERVMQKIGMQKIRNFLHPAIPDNHPLKEHVLYEIGISDLSFSENGQ